MPFDFDPAKSVANLKKHGIDFEAARALWNDSNLLEVPAQTIDEHRYLVVGRIGDKHWSAIITYRDETIRLISVRRSRKGEIARYESA